jgi:hypothetical protein
VKQTVHTCDVCGAERVETREVFISLSEGSGVYKKTLLNQTIDVCGACWAPEVKEGKRRLDLLSLFSALKPKATA